MTLHRKRQTLNTCAYVFAITLGCGFSTYVLADEKSDKTVIEPKAHDEVYLHCEGEKMKPADVEIRPSDRVLILSIGLKQEVLPLTASGTEYVGMARRDGTSFLKINRQTADYDYVIYFNEKDIHTRGKCVLRSAPNVQF